MARTRIADMRRPDICVRAIGFALSGVASAATLLVATAPAAASTIGLEPSPILGGDAAVYRAAPGETNQFVFLGQSGADLGFQDDVAITPIPPCGPHPAFPADTRFAACPAATVTAIGAFLGDGADSSGGMNPTPMFIDGEAGGDTLSGGVGDDLLLGGDGNDVMLGEPGNDVLDGGPGADDIRGNTGLPDDFGFDMADYGDRIAPVTVTLDGRRNDGEAGEQDLLALDIDDVNGGSANDTISGDEFANFLFGNDGDDVLDGGAGIDTLDGGNGNDTIMARDGAADRIACGAGVDTVTADPADAVVDCENVLLPAVPPPPPPVVTTLVTTAPAAPPAPAPAVARDLQAPRLVIGRLAPLRLTSALRRGFVVPVTCSEACTLRVVALFGGRPVARAARSAGAGLTARVRLRFSSAGARALHRRSTARLTLRIAGRDASGNGRTVTRSFTLRR
jgi:Ca2+-binding RTX toxin-like protein